MQTLRVPLRIVLYREDEQWLAHCLEFDLIGAGESRTDALDCLNDAITTQLEFSVAQDNPQNLFSPADGEYFEMFAAGNDVPDATLQSRVGSQHCGSIFIEKIDLREFLHQAGLVPA
jgi:predicted RNase H-like HicB family nuclease